MRETQFIQAVGTCARAIVSMAILTCPHKNEGDRITRCKSISPASRAIFVCLFESVMTVDEINIQIISFKILGNVNPIRIEQMAGPYHLPKAAISRQLNNSKIKQSFSKGAVAA